MANSRQSRAQRGATIPVNKLGFTRKMQKADNLDSPSYLTLAGKRLYTQAATPANPTRFLR
jgi:hypothetical protein